jgi:alkaline phosphatase D
MVPGSPLSRRQWLRLVGAGATWLAACGDNVTSAPPGDHDAAAIFEPLPDRFLVAVWSAEGGTAEIEVRHDGEVVTAQAIVLAVDGGHGVLDVTGLTPRTVYEVVVTTRGYVRLGPHQVQTAPADDDGAPVRLAVSADLDPSPQFASDLLTHLAAAAPEVYVSIGDFPYTDNGPPAMTVATYRERHAELRTLPAVRTWLQTVGVRAIYDDHEFRNNWDAHFVATEPERYAAAMQVWDEWFPLRDVVAEVYYRRWRWGAHVEGFLLDTRRFRSADDAPDDAAKTMLGATQRRWLLDGVAASTATFKLIFTTVPLDFGMGNDDWTSFATERDQIFAALVAAGATGVLFVSGDQHYFASHRHAYGIREFQIGPLARGIGMPGPLAPGVLYRSLQYNAGIVDVTATTLTFAGLGADGTRFHEEVLTVADLTPRLA